MVSKTIILGDEYDDALRDRLFQTLRASGAEMIGGDWGLAGSQELEVSRLRLAGADLVVEAETFVGLSLTGPAALVDDLAEKLRASAPP